MVMRKGMSEDERRAAYALRNFSPKEINRMHMEGTAKVEQAQARAEKNLLDAKAKESLASFQRELGFK